MKKINLIGILLTILILPIVYAHEEKVVEPGVTPDSFLWGLDKALDNLNLLLTFNPTEKARKGIEIARERLEEIKVMAGENKLEAAEKGKDEQVKVLSKVKKSISVIKEENATKQIEEEIEIERELEEHEEEVKEVSNILKIKIEVRGVLNEQQKALLDSILSTLANKTGEVKVEIKNKKDKTKIEIKQKTGKSEKEIEEEIEDIEKEKGLAELKKEKAAEEIEDAKENLAELEEELAEHKSEGHVADEKPITELIDNAKKRLTNAETAFKANDFGEAFGQANAAKQLIKNAEKILEKTVEKFEEEEEEHEMEEEREIEVEIKDGEAKIKVEIGDEKLKFKLETTDKNVILQEIAARTGLSVEEVTKLAEFEEEGDKEIDVVKFLCKPSEETGFKDRKIYISSNSEYYELVSVYTIEAIDESTGKIQKARLPVLDAPIKYYDKNGKYVSSCGGMLSSKDAFCTEILPKLSFDEKDLCLELTEEKEREKIEESKEENKTSTIKLIGWFNIIYGDPSGDQKFFLTDDKGTVTEIKITSNTKYVSVNSIIDFSRQKVKITGNYDTKTKIVEAVSIEKSETKEEKESKDKKSIIIKSEEVSLKCDSDEDCQLINKDINYRSCWPSACEAIDYSSNSYVAVNKNSFEEFKKSESQFRPAECGPAPGCPVKLINDNFVAKCVNKVCAKVTK